ncbi:oxysterol-binding protein-related protein 1A-like isoform X2 [Actinidia eriantha]|uniref:oxysterol-binding protein-related protein 1A-like isoform X2 n=1 Tax=Actinidia eriantha TaxID=165200 RepID=UPI00258A316A|nr:oxysterol-binding protein-related protein 1A-like isoform X2 [Actinidia eriantha]
MHPASSASASSSRSDSGRLAPQLGIREAKLSEIIGNGISGILYKWVNYGKGWRPRWFVLRDGVLSYYKIHGPDKIVVSHETENGSRVIGEDSLSRISCHKNGASQIPSFINTRESDR